MSKQPSAHAWPASLIPAAEWNLRVVHPERDDAALVTAAREGETTAFDELVTRHRRAVYQVCYRFVQNHEDASDLAQETFVRAWKGLSSFRGQAAFSTWLYRIAVNVSLNRVGGRTPEMMPIGPDSLRDPGAAPDAGLVRGERADAVRRAIAALPPRQRATVILRAYHDLPHREIAEILGSSVGAVKANFFHALANLRKLLGTEP